MDLDRTHLNDFKQAFYVLDIEILITFSLMLEFEGMNVFSQAFAGAALIETLAADAGRTAQQTERVP